MTRLGTNGTAVALLLALGGCADCGDHPGVPYTFSETPDQGIADATTTARDVASIADVAADHGRPTDGVEEADLPVDSGCAIPGYDAEPPLAEGAVRGQFACADGRLLQFDLPEEEFGCVEPGPYNGMHAGSRFRFGSVFAGHDGCSACSCGFDGSVECVSACENTTCTYGGRSLAAGETFVDDSGTRACGCRGDGTVVCATGPLNMAVGCLHDGLRVTSGVPLPTPAGDCGPCWCEAQGEISCIQPPSCGECVDDTGIGYAAGAGASFPECGACSCGTDQLWSCEQDCQLAATCQFGVTEVPVGTTVRHIGNTVTCTSDGLRSTLVGMPRCNELNTVPAARGEIFHSADGCTACLCGDFALGPPDPFRATTSCVETCVDGCMAGGRTYGTGEVFRADDGCNACICGADGVVHCTQLVCPNTQCGARRPGESWLADGDVPALCRCQPDGSTRCATERLCADEAWGGGECLPGEKCVSYRCEAAG